jgi:hypothetical protein
MANQSNEQQPKKAPILPHPKQAPPREKKTPEVPVRENDEEYVSDPMVPRKGPPQIKGQAK